MIVIEGLVNGGKAGRGSPRDLFCARKNRFECFAAKLLDVG